MNLWLLFVWIIVAVLLQLVLLTVLNKVMSNLVYIIKHILIF